MLVNKNIISIHKKMCNVRKEMIINKIKFYTQKTIPANIYYDQIEELNSTLDKLKNKENIICKDILEDWCKENPSDFECRIYE
jgi:hypothetical protein